VYGESCPLQFRVLQPMCCLRRLTAQLNSSGPDLIRWHPWQSVTRVFQLPMPILFPQVHCG
jgi:hypothetical protein